MRFIIPDREICVEKIKIPSKGHKIPALVLYPRQRPAQATGVLWIHGGGYITGMKEWYICQEPLTLLSTSARR